MGQAWMLSSAQAARSPAPLQVRIHLFKQLRCHGCGKSSEVRGKPQEFRTAFSGVSLAINASLSDLGSSAQ